MSDKERPKPFKVFLERLKREGKEKEWYVTVKAVMAETEPPRQYNSAQPIAMRRMGYVDWETESKLHEQYLASLRSGTSVMQEEIKAERSQANFDEVLAGLPNKADEKVENEWIAAHPAMLRKNRTKDATKQIIISTDDLLCAPCGKCPSKAAAGRLQHFANYPQKFYEIQERKAKPTEDGGGGGASGDAGIEEIGKLLDSLE